LKPVDVVFWFAAGAIVLAIVVLVCLAWFAPESVQLLDRR
jgi:hypothetical protein